jgi:4-hydroxythreonine-4-phosphate dehydrogenase
MQKPVVITCGDPSGIGPEIAVKAWRTLRNSIPIVWIGDKRHLPTNTPIVEVTSVTEAVGSCISAMPVLHHAFPKASTLGKPDTENAQSIIDVIKIGVNLVKNGSASALCTSPINKKVLIDGAQFAFPGHTEYLQHLTKAPTAVMMLASQS